MVQFKNKLYIINTTVLVSKLSEWYVYICMYVCLYMYVSIQSFIHESFVLLIF